MVYDEKYFSLLFRLNLTSCLHNIRKILWSHLAKIRVCYFYFGMVICLNPLWNSLMHFLWVQNIFERSWKQFGLSTSSSNFCLNPILLVRIIWRRDIEHLLCIPVLLLLVQNASQTNSFWKLSLFDLNDHAVVQRCLKFPHCYDHFSHRHDSC